ncbi:GNAT family N-acetyltransferase [Chitinophaga sp. Ak27]|uniref:GNAT family N-acetyltransferase n=1 Tax=Chitinophaga sp. Ak27 TaxID=2726116 RepID=UPI00145C82A7|nr:GNAT family N-acetyltransferase [Chitinophaga sp. Ak27]NLU93337.1 GNAT family N-acetyltransferase [Chitinophaga sp. Ak27]
MLTVPGDIVTPRLILRLLGTAVTQACLVPDPATAGQLLGIPVSTELLDAPNALAHDLRQLQQDAAYAPWASRAIILKAEMKMIGLIRFHSRPSSPAEKFYRENAAEMGYEIYPGHQRRGYAREAITSVMQWALETSGIHRFIASVAPENIASLSLVQGLGFMKVDEVVDETDGLEYVFLLDTHGNTGAGSLLC